MKHMLIRSIQAVIARRPGRHAALYASLESMPVEALRDLLQVLDGFSQDLGNAERTYRPFPGGPRIRM